MLTDMVCCVIAELVVEDVDSLDAYRMWVSELIGVAATEVCTLLTGIETVLTMDVRLGYTHDVGELHANWTQVAHSTEDRPLQCTVNKVTTLCVCVWQFTQHSVEPCGHGTAACVKEPHCCLSLAVNVCISMVCVCVCVCDSVFVYLWYIEWVWLWDGLQPAAAVWAGQCSTRSVSTQHSSAKQQSQRRRGQERPSQTQRDFRLRQYQTHTSHHVSCHITITWRLFW